MDSNNLDGLYTEIEKINADIETKKLESLLKDKVGYIIAFLTALTAIIFLLFFSSLSFLDSLSIGEMNQNQIKKKNYSS